MHQNFELHWHSFSVQDNVNIIITNSQQKYVSLKAMRRSGGTYIKNFIIKKIEIKSVHFISNKSLHPRQKSTTMYSKIDNIEQFWCEKPGLEPHYTPIQAPVSPLIGTARSKLIIKSSKFEISTKSWVKWSLYLPFWAKVFNNFQFWCEKPGLEPHYTPVQAPNCPLLSTDRSKLIILT